jgi:hypothetical protein
MNIMIEIPGFLHEFNHLSHSTGNMVEIGQKLRDITSRGMTVNNKLNKWFVNFLWQRGPTCYKKFIVPQPKDSVFPARYRFQNLFIAQNIIHFWASMVILARLFSLCQSLYQVTVPNSIGLRLDYSHLYSHAASGILPRPILKDAGSEDSEAIASHYADEICIAADYCIASDKGTSGPIIMLFPLWIAKDIYASKGDIISRQKEVFCTEIFKGLASRGLKISEALVSLSTQQSLAPASR